MDIISIQEEYTREGYIYLPGFVSVEELQTINNKLEEVDEENGLVYYGQSAKEDLAAKEAYRNALNKAKGQ